MSASLDFTQSQAFADLRAFLLAYLPTPLEVVQAQDNKVPEPKTADFVLMTPVYRERIETNIDTYADCAFIGSITGTVLTITEMLLGAVKTGATLFGSAVLDGTKIGAQITGTPGGIGTYNVSPTQQTPQGAIGEFVIGESAIGQAVAGILMASGSKNLLQPTLLYVQLDVHGPKSADNAQMISTLFRDDVAVDFFRDLGHENYPCYAEDWKQLPFTNDQQQVENRWVAEAVLQCNQTTIVPQQFAQYITVTLVSVDADFPPS